MESSGKKIAINQSNYIPWKGYFDMIGLVDEFVLYDDVQYTRRDWRNRNLIKTPRGVSWVSIPITWRSGQSIRDAMVSDRKWVERHWSLLKENYRAAPFFELYESTFEELYRKELGGEASLVCINATMIRVVAKMLSIQTPLVSSAEFDLLDGRTEGLVQICQERGATTYVSGPRAKDYLDCSQFHKAGISIEWMDYTGYPTYHQMHSPFVHCVTILDLIFNEGPRAPQFMKCGN